jgi:hypothetical protein
LEENLKFFPPEVLTGARSSKKVSPPAGIPLLPLLDAREREGVKGGSGEDACPREEWLRGSACPEGGRALKGKGVRGEGDGVGDLRSDP